MLTTKYAKRRETRRGVSSRFALGKIDGAVTVQDVFFFDILAYFVVKFLKPFTGFSRPCRAPFYCYFLLLTIVSFQDAAIQHDTKVYFHEKQRNSNERTRDNNGAMDIGHGRTFRSANAPVFLLFPDINRNTGCNTLRGNMIKNGFLQKEQEKAGERTGITGTSKKGGYAQPQSWLPGFLSGCNIIAPVGRCGGAGGSGNPTQSNLIKPNQAKSNQLFFGEITQAAGNCTGFFADADRSEFQQVPDCIRRQTMNNTLPDHGGREMLAV
jgi:hypothetical protein